MKMQSLGSGIIVSKDGFIVTSNHMTGGTDEVKVVISDGRELRAKVVGRDPKSDLALLKISSVFENLPILPLGDSEKVRELRDEVNSFAPLLASSPAPQAMLKEALRLLGHEISVCVKSPLPQLSNEQGEVVRRLLEDKGMI